MKLKILLLCLLFSGCSMAWAQMIINGVTKDVYGHSIPGVNVIVKGVPRGTTSDGDGKFQIVVHPDTSVLVFSFIGYRTTEYFVQEDENNIEVILKEDCIRCFLDGGLMELSINSGVMHSPLGGKISINYPIYQQRIVNAAYGYQTDLESNKQINYAVSLGHVMYNCNYDVNINFLYNKISITRFGMNFQSYLLEGNINFSRPKIFRYYSTLFLGVGTTRAILKNNLSAIDETGYMAGYGTYIGKPFQTFLSTKAIHWKDFWQFQSMISRQFKRVNVSLQWNHIEDYDELNMIVGFEINYWRAFRSRE